LAYGIEGSGTPVVSVHGLTCDRRTWRPITDQLGGSVMSIAIDLPAHGESGGEPTSLENVTEQIHRLLESPRVERPVLVGHSMAAGIAGLYASVHPVRGIVLVDQAMEVLPFARMLHQMHRCRGAAPSTRCGRTLRTASGWSASPNRPARWCWTHTRSNKMSCSGTGIRS
jgi:pimeloyl-ACP methyl ester carboxylesterase